MSSFLPLHTMNEVESFIQTNELSFLYITQPNCSVCHGLKPQINDLLKQYPKIKIAEIDALQVREVAGRFSIFTAPVLLFFVNGKEYIREARIVHTDLLDEKLARIYKNIVPSNY